jgi:Fe-S-cluster containining protein
MDNGTISYPVKFIGKRKNGKHSLERPDVDGKSAGDPENSHEGLRKETAGGLRYCHVRINDNTSKTLETTAFLYGLIEILLEKGLLTEEDSGIGLMYQDPEYDKYNFEHESYVDCEDCLQVCKALCCRFPFALSRQDVEEGTIKWDFSRPYLIAHGEDGYCVHLDRETCYCTVREHRPVPCRGFDCRQDKNWKVWLDFENKILNEALVDKLNKENNHP